ncbi:dTMP kinase [Mycobacterium uberis]|uniref:Thymidylate kinase n=1 Tax=Mycobacterium uberis TaxID=2162698 RepID=A0A3E1HHL6_9MYCO|nr:dTMP kinase [Mycobacterium uberis]RFD25907.1 dTMP kinase [Mycobacterium uberis]
MLIAIEGIDGAGKRTLSERLCQAFEAIGKSVATLAFPRYRRSVAADIAAEALHGQHGDLASSVYAMALLFAFDRAGAVEDIAAMRRNHDVVILDRYVASNAAYSAARLHDDFSGEAVAWVQQVEYQRLRLPSPDWQVLLAVSAKLAGERSRHRARVAPDWPRDSYECDDDLQQRTGAVYASLAAAGWGGRWLVVDADVEPGWLATALMGS